MSDFVIKGDICYCNEEKQIITKNSSYVVCKGNKCLGVFEELPDKYKDYIFRPSKNSGHKAIFVLKTIDEKGMLSQILKVIYDKQGNIISINQDTPLDGTAYITLAIDVSDLNSSIEQLKETMTTINGVKSVDIMGVE